MRRCRACGVLAAWMACTCLRLRPYARGSKAARACGSPSSARPGRVVRPRPGFGAGLELGLHPVAFGDPAGGAVGCADADNEPPASGRDPAAPGVAVDRLSNLRPLAGPEGGDDPGPDLDPGGIAG